MERSDEKFGKLQEQIGMLLKGMNGLMSSQEEDEVETLGESETEFDEGNYGGQQQRGVFRDPVHAEQLRQKQISSTYRKRSDDTKAEGIKVNKRMADTHSLKNLNLTFPSLKGGGDATEWLRDCDEYFSIFEVTDHSRPAIAAMHMTGTPRYWYKSFMVGRYKVTWQQFTQAFLDRFV